MSHDSTDQPIPTDSGRPAGRMRWTAIAAAALVVVAGAFFYGIKIHSPDPANRSLTAGQAAEQLYGALANAASQPRLRVGMYRETFANQAAADAGQKPGSILSSVSELDTTDGHYRSVFAHNYFHAPGFDVGRCLDGTTYNEDYSNINKNPRATSLKDISSHLELLPEGHLYKVTQPLTFIPCPRLGIIPGGSADLATARLSDGVFPVTLSREQAEAWRQKVTAAKLFTVADEGTVSKDGKTLRKYSLTPIRQTGINQQLFSIFYDTAEIEKVKDHAWQHGFIAINPSNTGSVGGFYLINEQTNLPVYSELYGTNPDRSSDESPAAGKNIARTKQNYTFPDHLTITLDTPLDFTE